MSIAGQRDKAKKYKFEAEWNHVDGWHFRFGKKRVWGTSKGYMFSELLPVDSDFESFQNHKEFLDLENALNYMRTGKL